jgi:tripartite-type tricarboxylate transporter receptor subunit TctC
MLLFCFWLTGPVLADNFPSKPVKILVTNPPGGSSDLMARILGQKLGDIWKQSVLIENRAGAAGLIGMTYVASQAPDGYTLLFGAQGSTIVTPLLSKVPYDMEKDFIPLSLAATGPSILMVNANSPYKTVQDLINAAKAKPNSINYGSGGVGTAAHLGAEMFNSYANIKTVHVPYKGGISAINDLAADQIQFQFTDAAPVIPFIKSGKLRPLAVTTPKRFASMPDVPTFVESGLPMFIAVNSWGVFMPAGASAAVVTQLQADIRKALSNPDLIKRYAELGFDAQNTSHEEFKALLVGENVRYSKLIRDAKIKGE